MKIEVWVATNKVGSKCSCTVDIPDEDVEGMSEQELEDFIDEYARDDIWRLMEWGWKKKDE